MTAVIVFHAILSTLLLGACGWLSNVWPGDVTWKMAALGRFLLWGLPFGIIVSFNGASLNHAVWMACAAWIGSWVPHVDCPSIEDHSAAMLFDLAVVAIRVLVLIAPPTAVFWLCGANWVSMVTAVGFMVPCIYAGNVLAPLPWAGLRTRRDIAGALFAAVIGMSLTLAIIVPEQAPDLLN